MPDSTAGPGARLLDRYDAFALDIDGVVWLAGTVLAEAAPALAAMREAGKRRLLLTNNASYVPSWIVTHLAEAGIDVGEDEILTSSAAARAWIVRQGLAGKRAFVLGVQTVVDQVSDLLDVVPVERGVSVDVVLVARDLDLTYDRLAAAAGAVRDGAVFLASNRDHVMPTPHGFEPGTGAVLAAVEAASGQRATSMGKPELPMMQAAAERIGGGKILMVGDRPDSDIAGARRIGWDAALVLTGVTKAGMPMDPVPDYVLPTLAGLLEVPNQGR